MDIISWIIGILFTVILTTLITDKLHYLLALLFGGTFFNLKRGLRGVWKSTYNYKQNKKQFKENQIIELRQFGKYVIGRNISGKKHFYKMIGKLEKDIYYTGIWENISNNDIYHGAFQFIYILKGNKIKGKWLGFNSKNQINHGDWSMKFIAKKVTKTEKEELISNMSPLK